MSIRSRIIGIDGIAFVQSQTNLTIGAIRVPSKARVRAVRVHTVTVTGGTPTVSVMRSATMLADDTAANSTTLIHDAAISVAASDTPYSDPMTGQFFVEKGVWLYVKYTTAAGVSTTSTSIQVELDY